MKRTFSIVLAILLCLGLFAAAALAEEPAETAEYFTLNDGYISGTYPGEAGDFIEIKLVLPDGAPTNAGAAGMGNVTFKAKVEESGEYIVTVYKNGELVDMQSFTVEGETPEPTAEPTAAPEPTAEPTATPEPTVEPTAVPEPTVAPTATPEPTAEPTAAPEPLKLAVDEEGKTAQVTGDFSGLYARVALILDNNGVSGLYVTQAPINSDGTIVIPEFMVPGLTVKGVNVALVPTLDDIQSAMPNTVVFAMHMF